MAASIFLGDAQLAPRLGGDNSQNCSQIRRRYPHVINAFDELSLVIKTGMKLDGTCLRWELCFRIQATVIKLHVAIWTDENIDQTKPNKSALIFEDGAPIIQGISAATDNMGLLATKCHANLIIKGELSAFRVFDRMFGYLQTRRRCLFSD